MLSMNFAGAHTNRFQFTEYLYNICICSFVPCTRQRMTACQNRPWRPNSQTAIPSGRG